MESGNGYQLTQEELQAYNERGQDVFGVTEHTEFVNGEWVHTASYYKTDAKSSQTASVSKRNGVKTLSVWSAPGKIDKFITRMTVKPRKYVRSELKRMKDQDFDETWEEMKDGVEQIEGAVEAGNTYQDKIDRLLEMEGWLMNCPEAEKRWRTSIAMNKAALMMRQLMTSTVTIADMFNPIPTEFMGFGFDVGEYVGNMNDGIDQANLNRLENYILQSIKVYCDDKCKGGQCGGGGSEGGSGGSGGSGSGGGNGNGIGVPVADPVYIYDPSGYVYEAYADNRIPDVKATVFYRDDEDGGKWKVWDADWFGQINPQQTNAEGRYGWDVPPGWWRVVYEKAGYRTAQSAEMDVPPPRFDVNIAMISLDAPTVSSVKAQRTDTGGEVEITFTKPIQLQLLQDAAVTAKTAEGADIEGHIDTDGYVQTGEGGMQLVKRIRFVPDAEQLTKFAAGVQIRIALDPGFIVSYAGTPMEAAYSSDAVTVEIKDATPPRVTAAGTSATGEELIVTFDESMDPTTMQSAAGVILAGTNAKIAGATDASSDLSRQTWKLLLDRKAAPGDKLHITIPGGLLKDAAGNALNEVKIDVANAMPSNDAGLSSIQVNNGSAKLEPEFAAAVSDYSVLVPNTGEYYLNLQKSDPNAKLQVNGVAYAGFNDRIQLTEKSTLIPITVIAADGSTKRHYSLNVIRADTQVPPDGSGNNSSSPVTQPDIGTMQKDEESVSLEDPETRYSAYGGEVTVGIPAGGKAGAKVNIRRVLPSASLITGGYTLASNVFEVNTEQPISLGLVYETSKLPQGEDVRKLGLYRLDAADGWVYAGGVVDSGAKRVETAIAESGTYAVMLYTKPFGDLAGHWSRSDVEVLVSRHVIDGVGEGRFEPDRSVTRAELTKLLVSFLRPLYGWGNELPDEEAFADVNSGDWFYSYVETGFKYGLVQGDAAGFRPNDKVTREEMIVMVYRALSFNKPDEAASERELLQSYRDAELVSEWAKEAIAFGIGHGLIDGFEDGSLQPQGEASRGQAAAVILRTMNLLNLINKEQ
jgi:hypothetical protein